MKIVTYKGKCQSISKFGEKFTKEHKSAIVSDESSKAFEMFDDFIIHDVPKNDIVPPKNKEDEVEETNQGEEEVEQSEDSEDPDKAVLRKKLQRLKVDQLEIMCREKGLETGTKAQMIEELIA